MFPYPLVLVEWKDHHADNNWVKSKDIELKPEYCLSVGWLVKEDDEAITVVSCIDPKDPINGAMGNTWYILKSCITMQKVLRKAKTPRKKNG